MKTLQDAMREITNLLSGEPSEENVSEAYNIASQFREPSTEQSGGTEQEELKILKALVVALNKYIDSIGGRDLVYDKAAADEVQRLSEEWFIKFTR